MQWDWASDTGGEQREQYSCLSCLYLTQGMSPPPGSNMNGLHSLNLQANPPLPSPARMSCPFPIRVVVEFRWMSLLTLVYTTQQSTLQHIPYPGTTKLWEWYIWHSRKLLRESMGIYNYYTIKQVSTRMADFCPTCPWQWCQMQLRLPHGNWIHSFLSTCEWPQSASSLSSESPYYLPHRTLASDTTLTVCASAFSSQGCDEPKT